MSLRIYLLRIDINSSVEENPQLSLGCHKHGSTLRPVIKVASPSIDSLDTKHFKLSFGNNTEIATSES